MIDGESVTNVRCYLLPEDCPEMIGPNVVVIDVLRATTTICTALANEAAAVKPFLEFEDAVKWAEQQTKPTLTGGERGGKKLPGFDLGNSPFEFSREKVGQKIIAFSTTNGTRAMEKCKGAANVAMGAFCNLKAVTAHFKGQSQLDIICAGTDRQFSVEDSAFAGSLIELFCKDTEHSLNQAAKSSLQLWMDSKSCLLETLRGGTGGANLIRLGRDKDIEFAAQLDAFTIVPILNIERWIIEPA